MEVLLSSAIFGLLHSYQGMNGILRTALIGLVLAVPFLLTGSILPSMMPMPPSTSSSESGLPTGCCDGSGSGSDGLYSAGLT